MGGSAGATTGGSGGAPDGGMSTEAGPFVDAGGNGGPIDGGVAGELHGAYVELTCATRITTQFCGPQPGQADQKIMLQFGGQVGTTYDVVLKVWGIVEQQTYSTGMPLGEHLYIGGTETTVGNANYSVYGLQIGATNIWLNRFPTAGGDKVVAMYYTAPAIKIPGGSTIILRHYDKNNHMTRNFDRLSVPEPTPGLMAKIKMQPFDGAFLYIEVASATPVP